MGPSQSTNRAAKFSGSGKCVRSCHNVPATDPMLRRQLSQRNTNRNVKEFSKFWSDGGSFRPKSGCSRRSESVRRSNSVRRTRTTSAEPSQRSPRSITPLSTPYITQRSPRNSHPELLPRRSLSQRGSHLALAPFAPVYDSFDNNVIFDSNTARVFESNPERLNALRFPHETAIY